METTADLATARSASVGRAMLATLALFFVPRPGGSRERFRCVADFAACHGGRSAHRDGQYADGRTHRLRCDDTHTIRGFRVDAHDGDGPIFADFVVRSGNEIFAEALLARLETETNPKIYLQIAKILLAFSKPEINRRMRRASEKNEALKSGWGGRAFEALLMKQKIP